MAPLPPLTLLRALAAALASAAAASAAMSCDPGSYWSAASRACEACAPNTFSYGNTTACAPCAAGALFVTASQGCVPLASAWPSPVDSIFFFSGARTEGVAAFSLQQPEGIDFVVDAFGNEQGAMSVAAGTMLVTQQLEILPSDGTPRTISAWVRCPAPPQTQVQAVVDGGQESVGLISFFDGVSMTRGAVASTPRLLMYGNLTDGGDGGAQGLSPPVCTDCFRSDVTTLAGNGTWGFADGPALTDAMFDGRAFLFGSTVTDSSGTTYFADYLHSVVRAISSPASGQSVVTTIAGVEGVPYLSPGCIGSPHGVCLDADETALFIAVPGFNECNCIYRIELATGHSSVVAGSPTNYSSTGYLDAVGTNSRFSHPGCVVSDSKGVLYVSDWYNGAVRRVKTHEGYNVSTLAQYDFNTSLWYSIAIDASEELLYAADFRSGQIWSVRIADGAMQVLVTITGSPSPLAKLFGIAADANGRLFVTDTGENFIDNPNNMVYAVDVNSLAISAVAGGLAALPDGGTGGFADGRGDQALFNFPTTLSVSRDGKNLIVADRFNARLRGVQWPTGPPNSIDTRFVMPGLCEGNATRWHHFAVTLDSSSALTLYVDGVEALLPVTAALSFSTVALQIGGQLAPATLFSSVASAAFSGAISDLRIFERALTPVEVSSLTTPMYLIPVAGRFMVSAPDPENPAKDIYSWLCPQGYTGPVVQLRFTSVSNSWVWSRAGGIGCDVPPASDTNRTMTPAVIGSTAASSVVFVALVISYFVMRRRVRAQLKALEGKTTLAARALERARLLALQAMPNAPECAIDFETGTVRTVQELLAPLPVQKAPSIPNLSLLRGLGFGSPVPPPELQQPLLLEMSPAAEPPRSPKAKERIIEIKWSELVPDLSFRPKFGGFGAVFMARWTPKRKVVAVKVLKSAMLTATQSIAAVEMLMHEAQGLARASDNGVNAHVVQVFGVAQGLAEGWQNAQRAARIAETQMERRKRARTQQTASKNAARVAAERATGAAAGSGAGSAAAVAGLAVADSKGSSSITASSSNNASSSDGNNPSSDDVNEEDAALVDNGLGSERPAPFLFGLIMSFESGGSCLETLFPKRGGTSWPSAMLDRLRVLKEVATGLYQLHAIGLVHGDLKLDNVLLTGGPEPHVRLADFGLATLRAQADRTSRISTIAMTDTKRGTFSYMAPEMFATRTTRAATASRSTDVFAFGTLAWELLTSQLAWDGQSESDRLLALGRGESLSASALPIGTPGSIAALVARCMSLERSDRPRMAEALAILEQAHENLLSGRFVSSVRAARAHFARTYAMPKPPSVRPLKDVFLSYSWGENGVRKALADEIYLALRAAGMSVWIDEAEMGLDLVASMSEGIAKSSVVVVLVSPDYAASANCMFELRSAVAARKPLVTCCVELGFWKTWGLDNAGSAGGAGGAGGTGGKRSVPDDHELARLARLSTHLFVDLGLCSTVHWASETVTPAERRLLQAPEAMPRLLRLLAESRAALKVAEEAAALRNLQLSLSLRAMAQAALDKATTERIAATARLGEAEVLAARRIAESHRKADVVRQAHHAAAIALSTAPEADSDEALDRVNACHSALRMAKAEEKRIGETEALRLNELRAILAVCVRTREDATEALALRRREEASV